MTTDTPDPFALPACFERFTGPQDHEPAPAYVALMTCCGVDVLAGFPHQKRTRRRMHFTSASVQKAREINCKTM